MSAFATSQCNATSGRMSRPQRGRSQGRTGTSRVRGGRLGVKWRVFVLAAVLSLVGGCGLSSSRVPAAEAIGPLETNRMTVAMLKAVESVPLMLAVEEGWFAELGLDVDIKVVGSDRDVVNGLVAGEHDIAQGSYVLLVGAQATQAVDLRIVTDNSYATLDTAVLVTMPDSSTSSIQELEGARIAVPERDNSAELMVKSAMEANSLNFTTVVWRPMQLHQMTAALQRGEVDAAMLVEPYITTTKMAIGATQLLDLSIGPTRELPLTAYSATAEFVRTHPETIKVFQLVMRRATEVAGNRARAEAVLPKVVDIDQRYTPLLNLPGFRSSLDYGRIQRVAVLMKNFGMLKSPFDVSHMLAPDPTDLTSG